MGDKILSGAKRTFGGLLFLLLSVIAGFAVENFPQLGGGDIELKSLPIDAFLTGDEKQNFGALSFLSGAAISSSDNRFGAFSGLAISADGQSILAVSDTGYWLSAKIQYDRQNQLSLVNGRLAPINDIKGMPLNTYNKWSADAEGLLVANFFDKPYALVSYERYRKQFELFDLTESGPKARPHGAIEAPTRIDNLRGNKGLEAISVAPSPSLMAGRLIAVAERKLTNGHHTGWAMKLSPPAHGYTLSGRDHFEFYIKRRGNFDITDAEFLPNGDLLLLERKFSLMEGSAIRIRRLASRDLDPVKLSRGIVVDGVDLMTADLSHQIDNLEGMAVHISPEGQAIITLISDDNMNFFQRTLLLQFALRKEEFGVVPKARPLAPIGPAINATSLFQTN